MGFLTGNVAGDTSGGRAVDATFACTLALHGEDLAIIDGASKDRAEAVAAETRASGQRASVNTHDWHIYATND